MLYYPFNKKTTEEVTEILLTKERVVLHDDTKYTDLGRLLKHIPKDEILSVSIELNTEDLWRFSEFQIVFKLVSGCTILIISRCCIETYAKLEQFVLNIMEPLKVIQSKITLEKSAWKTDEQFIKKALEVARKDKPNQFPTFDDVDAYTPPESTAKMSVLDDRTIAHILEKTRKN